MSTLKTDYTAEGLLRLLTTLQGGANYEALASSFLDRCQELETAAFPLYTERNIDTATGDRLNRIGQLFLVPRDNRTDDDYRLRLRAEIAILTSIGTEYDLVRVAQLLVSAADPTNLNYIEFYPKTAFVRVVDHIVTGSVADQVITAALLQRAAPAGTEVHFLYSLIESDDTKVFKFSATAAVTETLATYGTESGSLAGVA